MTSTGGLTFTTTMGVIDGIHNNTPNLRTLSKPTGTTSLTDGNVHMVLVTNGTDGGGTLIEHHPHLAGGHLEGDVIPFLGDQSGAGTGGPNKLPTPAELKLNVVNLKSQGNKFNGKLFPTSMGALGPFMI